MPEIDNIETPRLIELAESGDDPSLQFTLASRYSGGDHPEWILALWWFERAAASGCPEADTCAGVILLNGLGGVPRNDAEAVKCFSRAAYTDPDAASQLSLCFARARGGLPLDLIQSWVFMSLAIYRSTTRKQRRLHRRMRRAIERLMSRSMVRVASRQAHLIIKALKPRTL